MRDTIVVFPDNQFMQNYHYLRKKNHLSHVSLACLLGVSCRRLRKVEEQLVRNEMELTLLRRLSQIYDLDVDKMAREDLSGPQSLQKMPPLV